jgi:sulfoxide reductase heme-binding subunit YedZ
MNRSTITLLKTATWIACLWPLGILVWGAVMNRLGPDPIATITFTTGSTTLNLLTLSLAVTPVRRIVKPLAWIGPWRKILGLFAFFYATLHLFTWIALYAGFNPQAMAADILRRRYITMGMAAWLLLLPLAATSFNWAIRKMGGRRWKKLHRLVYLAAVCGVIHYWWQVKPGVLKPLNITIILAVLLAARPVLDWIQDRKVRTTPPKPATSNVVR